MCTNGGSKYSPKTLVGYWREMREREEVSRAPPMKLAYSQVDQAIYLERCAKGQLVVQKMALLEGTFLKPVATSGPRDSYLHYNDRVGLVCLPPPEERVRVNHSRERPPLLISATVEERLIYGSMKLTNGHSIVACTEIKPLAKSIFQVTSCNTCPPECKVTYGTPIQLVLATEGLSDVPLYLASDTVTAIGATTPKSGKRRVFLHSDKQDYNTFWKFQHVDPRMRLEYEGLPVPVNTPVIMRHCKTNSALAIENSVSRGLYGYEYEVSTCDHLDRHGVESDANQICVCTDLGMWADTDEKATENDKCSKTRQCPLPSPHQQEALPDQKAPIANVFCTKK